MDEPLVTEHTDDLSGCPPDRVAELEEQVRRLEEQIERNDELLSVAAHDLRGQMTVLLGWSRILERWEDIAPERRERAIRAIIHETKALNRHIGELLDVSRVARRTLPAHLQCDQVDLVALAREAIEGRRASTPARVWTLEVSPEPAIGWWDRARLAQVLDILLDNAVQFSPEESTITVRISGPRGKARGMTRGRARLDVSAGQEAPWPMLGRSDVKTAVEPVPSAGRFVVVEVADQGAGLAPEELPRVFDRFVRLSSTRRPKGGLHLYLARGIVEAHGGHLAVESEPGRGCVFRLRLPA